MIKLLVDGNVVVSVGDNVKVEVVQEPERKPKYKKGDWFVHVTGLDELLQIVGDGFSDNSGSVLYVYRKVRYGVERFIPSSCTSRSCVREVALDHSWQPIPPQPAVPDGEDLSWVVKVPVDGERFIGCGTNTGRACVFGEGGHSLLTNYYAGRRWILKAKPKKTGFVVWEPGIKPDGRVMLKLQQAAHNRVCVEVVDAYGNCVDQGHLADFEPSGLYCWEEVSKSFGIPLDGNNKIELI